ncbi:MAG: 30S ribosomal protein S14 [Beijerinckiaceae bacterium]
MAKKGMIEKNNRRIKLVAQQATKRARLKTIIMNKEASLEERFAASLKLAQLPRNASATRVKNRCEISGRPRGYYRKLKMSRIAMRDLGNSGLVPGLTKSSW